MSPRRSDRSDTRERVIEAAFALLTQGGREAVSTRAVSEAAGIQSPTIYRLFGDKQGLLDAVAAYGFAGYVTTWSTQAPAADPVDGLRRAWDLNLGFGLANPYLYSLIYGSPTPGVTPPAAAALDAILIADLTRIAAAGRLRLPTERAVALFRAAGSGVTLALIAVPEDVRDDGLSDVARETVIAAIVGRPRAARAAGPAGAANQLRAALPELAVLTDSERGLLDEWLRRVSRRDPVTSGR